MTPSEGWLGALALLVAAPCVGSFAGVVVDRLRQGRSPLTGRSRCAACDRTLGWRDLAPIVSWLVSRGRCRHCGAAISALYPALELGTTVIAAWSLAVLPGSLALIGAALGWLLLALATIDWRAGVLPDALTLPLLGLGLAVIGWLDAGRLPEHALGAALGFAVLWLAGAAYRRLRGRDGLGSGDAVLMAAAGAWVSWQGLASVLLIGAASGLVAALIAAKSGHGLSADTRLPFGPFLALGLWLVWLYGPLQLSLV